MSSLTLADIQKVATDICRGVVAPAAARTDREAAFPAASLAAIGEAGLMGLVVPEEFGGAGLGFRELTMAAEVLASECPSTALIVVAHGAACSAIAMACAPALSRRLLPDLATGKRLAGCAIHELSSGGMAAPIATRASRVEKGLRLTGSKPFVTAANHLDVAVTLANLDPSGPSLFAVETCLRGVSRGKPEGALGLRGATAAELSLDDCAIPGDALLGSGGDGLKILRPTIGTVGRFGLAGAALGIARTVRALVTAHTRSRVTAGMPLVERPAVLAKLATIAMTVDAIEAVLSRHTDEAAQHPERAPAFAAKVKLFATEQAVAVARDGLELTGAHGYFGAVGTDRFLRDALGLTIHLGPSALLREDVGRLEATR